MSIQPIGQASWPKIHRHTEEKPPFWKTALVALLTLNPAAYAQRVSASNYCPVAYNSLQGLCPVNALPEVTYGEIVACSKLMSSDHATNIAHCRKSVKALQPYNLWRKACEKEDVKRVQSLCDYGLDFGYAFKEAMEQANSSGHVIDEDSAIYAIFESMLKAGADPNHAFTVREYNRFKGPALSHFYRNKNQMGKLIDLFLKFGANPMVKDSQEIAVTIQAIQDNDYPLSEKFLSAKEVPKTVEFRENTAGFNEKMVELLQRHNIVLECMNLSQ